MNRRIVFILLAVLAILLLLFGMNACKKGPNMKVKKDEIILLLNDSSPAEIQKIIKKVADTLAVAVSEVTTKPCKCDAGLIKISAPGLTELFLAGQRGPHVTTGPGSAGDDAAIFGLVAGSFNAETNIEIEQPQKDINTIWPGWIYTIFHKDKANAYTKHATPNTDPIGSIAPIPIIANPQKIIAVLDGGLKDESTLNNPLFWKETIESRNFTHENNYAGPPIIKGTTNSHGQNVVSVLSHEMANLNITDTQIMVLKVLDENGKGDIFDILCAIMYAYQKDADILNLSLGYYGIKSDILKQFMKASSLNRGFTDKWIVAAAGNTDIFADSHEKHIDNRDLDQRVNKFYPACYSDSIANLISITTAGLSSDVVYGVSPNTNFSENYVDYGVFCNDMANKYGFEINTARGSKRIEGSSFAAPVFTAFLASTLSSLSGTNKLAILPIIPTPAGLSGAKTKNSKLIFRAAKRTP
jgi:hypothetical protein